VQRTVRRRSYRFTFQLRFSLPITVCPLSRTSRSSLPRPSAYRLVAMPTASALHTLCNFQNGNPGVQDPVVIGLGRISDERNEKRISARERNQYERERAHGRSLMGRHLPYARMSRRIVYNNPCGYRAPTLWSTLEPELRDTQTWSSGIGKTATSPASQGCKNPNPTSPFR